MCVCVCVCVCVAFPKLSGSLPATTYSSYHDGHLTTPTSAPGGAIPVDSLGAGTTNAHTRQPSDSGSVGSTGSSNRPPANGSPQHQHHAHGYSLLSTQNHGDGGGGLPVQPPRGRSMSMAVAGVPLQPMRRIKSPGQDIKPRPTSARRSRIDFHPPGIYICKNRDKDGV